jgi:hypothetical protein
MPNELKIDYKRFEVRDPAAILNYGVELYEEIKNELGGPAESIAYTYGTYKTNIIIKSKKETLTILPPENGEDALKIAALLYVIGKNCCKKVDIHYHPSNKNNIIDTRHTKKGRSKTQEYLDNLT